MAARRFPPPWQVVEHAESFWVQDANDQTVGWFYFRDNPETARHAVVLERDEARRMAVKLRPDAGAAGEDLIATERTDSPAMRRARVEEPKLESGYCSSGR